MDLAILGGSCGMKLKIMDKEELEVLRKALIEFNEDGDIARRMLERLDKGTQPQVGDKVLDVRPDKYSGEVEVITKYVVMTGNCFSNETSCLLSMTRSKDDLTGWVDFDQMEWSKKDKAWRLYK